MRIKRPLLFGKGIFLHGNRATLARLEVLKEMTIYPPLHNLRHFARAFPALAALVMSALCPAYGVLLPGLPFPASPLPFRLPLPLFRCCTFGAVKTCHYIAVIVRFSANIAGING